MKTKHFACLLAALATLAAVSCNKEDKPAKLTVAETEITVPATPGTGKIVYTLENPIDGEVVAASCEAEWLHDFSTATEGEISFSVDQNFEEERSASVVVTYSNLAPATVTVKQMAADENIVTDPTELTFTAEASELKVKVTSARNWTLTSEAEWVVPSVTEGAPDAEVTFTATANPTLEVRTAEFAFHLYNSSNIYTLVVKQDAAKPVSLFVDENFKKYMLNNFDKDGDGDFSSEELAASGEISYSEETDGVVSSFAGVELFPNITSFTFEAPYYSKPESTVSELDLSKNTALTYVKVQDKQLSGINLSGLSKVEEINVANDTALHVLDISSCTALKTVYAQNSGLRTFDTSKNPNLSVATIYGTRITSLDFSKNPELTRLSATTDSLEKITFSGNEKLESISLSFKNVTTMPDLSNFPALTSFTGNYYGGETFALAGSPNLKSLTLEDGAAIKTIDVHYNPKLSDATFMWLDNLSKVIVLSTQDPTDWWFMSCGSYTTEVVEKEVPSDIATVITDATLKTYLISVADADKDGKISKAEAEDVSEIDISGKGIASVDGLEWFTGLRTIEASNNSITTFDGSAFTSLKKINISNNKLTSLSVGGEVIDASYNELTSFDYTGDYGDLEQVNLSHNQLTGPLSFKYYSYLKTLNLSDNKLEQLTLNSLPSLATLDISNNNIQRLTSSYENGLYLTSCNALKTVIANKFGTTYGLDTIFKSKPNLEHLELQGTDATTLYININTSGNGTLTYLDVTGATSLTKVYVGASAVIEDANIKKEATTEIVRADE